MSDPDPQADDAATDEPDDAVELLDGQLAYDCADWAGESRGMLTSLLTSAEIQHVWQGTTLTVHESDETAVDDLVDEVLAAARPALDPDEPKLVYEVAEWPVALQTELAESLTAADVPYAWDERGDLVVRESDEEAVTEVMDELPDAEEGDISSDDGVAVHEQLDAAFMASSRLVKHPNDAAATVRVVEVASVFERLAPPFGFEPSEWRQLVSGLTELRTSIDGTDEDPAEAVSDQDISAQAAAVRDRVRRYI